MAVIPPAIMAIKAEASQFMEAAAEAKKATSLRPSDYQIRLDAMSLAVQAASAVPDVLSTPAVFAEWTACMEAYLRGDTANG